MIKNLCNWMPSSFDEGTIRSEFLDLLRFHGFSDPVNLDIRDPVVNQQSVDFERFKNSEFSNLHFHYDAGAENYLIAFWSNKLSTDCKLPDGSIFQNHDGNVTVVDNSKIQHRTPVGEPLENDRWLVRASRIEPRSQKCQEWWAK